LFTLRVVKPWPRLPRELGDAPSPETFKARLDRAQNVPDLVGDVLAHCRGLGLGGLLNPKYSVIPFVQNACIY